MLDNPLIAIIIIQSVAIAFLVIAVPRRIRNLVTLTEKTVYKEEIELDATLLNESSILFEDKHGSN